jgi:hypothetical protein
MFFIFSNKPVFKLETYIYIGLYILIVFFGSYLLNIILSITDSYLPKYLNYFEQEEGVKLSSGFGLIIYLILYVFILFFAKTDTPSDRVFYRIGAVFIIFSQIGMISNILSRLALYFVPALLVVIPQLLSQNINRILKLGFISIFLFMVFYSFYIHYTSDTYFEKYFHYNTIFSELF